MAPVDACLQGVFTPVGIRCITCWLKKHSYIPTPKQKNSSKASFNVYFAYEQESGLYTKRNLVELQSNKSQLLPRTGTAEPGLKEPVLHHPLPEATFNTIIQQFSHIRYCSFSQIIIHKIITDRILRGHIRQ